MPVSTHHTPPAFIRHRSDAPIDPIPLRQRSSPHHGVHRDGPQPLQDRPSTSWWSLSSPAVAIGLGVWFLAGRLPPATHFVTVGDSTIDLNKVELIGPTICSDHGPSGRCTFVVEFTAPTYELYSGRNGTYAATRQFGTNGTKGSEAVFIVIWDEKGIVDNTDYDGSIPRTENEARELTAKLRQTLPR